MDVLAGVVVGAVLGWLLGSHQRVHVVVPDAEVSLALAARLRALLGRLDPPHGDDP